MASTGEVWKLGHRPALDGVRGVAVLLVLVAHSHVPLVETAGPVGVTVFFTLSGFLITSLLLEDHQEHDRICFGRFYRRRARRLMPAALACMVAVALLGLVLPSPGEDGLPGRFFLDWPGLVAALTYLSNWYLALDPTHYIGALSHTWSLAIEEQFYGVWPVLIACVAGRRRLLLAISAAGALGSVLARIALWDGGAGEWRVYFGTDTRADALLIGCALAAGMSRWGAPRPKPRVAITAVAGVTGMSLTTGAVAHIVTPLAVAMLAAVAIAFSVGGGCRSLEWGPLRLVGLRSYGLYLWHFPVAVLLEWHIGKEAWPAYLAVMVPTAWCLALLSWRYIERPFLRAEPHPDSGALTGGGVVKVGLVRR